MNYLPYKSNRMRHIFTIQKHVRIQNYVHRENIKVSILLYIPRILPEK